MSRQVWRDSAGEYQADEPAVVEGEISITSDMQMLLLLSRFSHVRLCATPWTAAYQASPSMRFSRQEHWSGLPCPSPVHESEE